MDRQLEKILENVQKPGRYVGGEPNAVIKDKKDVEVSFAFCFPDTYEIGMSYLGMKILYSLYNSLPFVRCERVFAPWIDMEDEMRKENVPLYALESFDPVKEFDIIGFTLQYELSYTNILNMLSLSGVPLLAKDRTGLQNLVIAGGPCACNPEPLADFIDLFFLGEGEESGVEFLNLYRKCKKEGKSKEELILEAVKLGGVYAPSLYTFSYHEDGTIAEITSKEGAPEKVHKRIVADLDQAFYPEKFITPLIEIVHDRAVDEIFRGCIRGCRFCQAGFMNRPLREKSVKTIDSQCRSLCKTTGYEEVSLLSLSTSDYSEIDELIDTLNAWAEGEKVSVSLPSLRVDGFTNELTEKIKSVRKGGLTFAPEAGTQRLRDVINKDVTEEQLLATSDIAFSGGWNKIKLYFMIGLPTENDEDITGIARLGQAVVNRFYACENRAKGKSVTVTLSVAAFVPKPFTPFQWEAQNDVKTFEQKQRLLVSSVTTKKINCNYHDASTSWLEGVFARGDRRLCKVLLEAQKRGIRFDGWDDCFSIDRWLSVFYDLGVDPSFYNCRKRSFDEILPWDRIDYGVRKDYLIRECERAYRAEITPNCRKKCSGCGASSYKNVKGGVCGGTGETVVLENEDR